MELRYLLDTNIFIYIRQGRPEVIRRFAKIRTGEAGVSIISYGELFSAPPSVAAATMTWNGYAL
jgi:predicted nucleic acid-binding protein